MTEYPLVIKSCIIHRVPGVAKTYGVVVFNVRGSHFFYASATDGMWVTYFFHFCCCVLLICKTATCGSFHICTLCKEQLSQDMYKNNKSINQNKSMLFHVNNDIGRYGLKCSTCTSMWDASTFHLYQNYNCK